MFEIEDFIVEECEEEIELLEANFFNSIRSAMKQIADTKPNFVKLTQRKCKKELKKRK